MTTTKARRHEESERGLRVLVSSWLAMTTIGLTLVLALYLYALTPVMSGVLFDEGWYAVLGKSLAEGMGFARPEGLGYVAETTHPPGYPLLLAPIWMLQPLFPENVLLLKLPSVLFAVGTAVLVYWLFLVTGSGRAGRDAGRRRWALAVAAFLVLNPSITVGYGGLVLSETAYAFWSIAGILLVEKYVRILPSSGRSRTARVAWALASALAITLAYMTRTVGYTLLGACALYLIPRLRRDRVAIVLILAATLTGAAWTARTLVLEGSVVPRYYVATFTRDVPPEVGEGREVGVVEVVARAADSAVGESARELLQVMVPSLWNQSAQDFLTRTGLTPLRDALPKALLLLTIVGFASEVREKLRLQHLYTLAYSVALFTFVHHDYRLWLPVLPFLFGYCYSACALAGRQKLVLGRLACGVRVAAPLAVGALLLSYLVIDVRAAQEYRTRGYGPVPLPMAAAQPTINDGFRWLRDNVPGDQSILAVATMPMHEYPLRTNRAWIGLGPYAFSPSAAGAVDQASLPSPSGPVADLLAMIERTGASYLAVGDWVPENTLDWGKIGWPVQRSSYSAGDWRMETVFSTSGHSGGELMVYRVARAGLSLSASKGGQ